MFTGIVESTGEVLAITGNTFRFGHHFTEPLTIGESVAVNGMCVTVTNFSAPRLAADKGFFEADIIAESLRRTVFDQVQVGDKVNLERSARIGDRNSGHMVSGHIDETGEIVQLEQRDDFWLVRMKFSADFFPLVIFKGSVALDGVSLTVSAVSEDQNDPWLEVSIIPHTWQETIWHTKSVGERVNIEFDQVGKYLLRQK